MESIITVISTATSKGDLEQVKALLTQDPRLVNVHEKKYGKTPLHNAATDGHKDVVELLLTHGAEVDAPNKDGITSLFLAARGGYLEVTRMLLDNGADVNAKKSLGFPPIHGAGYGGYLGRYLEVTRMLLDNGADVNAKNREGSSVR